MNMKIFAASILVLIGLVSAIPANAICTKHTITGNLLSDSWGPDLTKDWSVNDTWLPNDGITFVVADNYNPKYADATHPSGVHIMGLGKNYTFYDEPKVLDRNGELVPLPYADDAEMYDIEAMYFDQDANCIYVAVVTSESPNATGWATPGDLAMNLDNDNATGKYGYEYGVKLTNNYGLNQFGLYSNPDWQETYFIPANRPSDFDNGTYLSQVMGTYTDIGIPDREHPNYVVELAIPKYKVGDPSAVGMGNLHLSEACGNDILPPAPEFPFILVPLAITAIAPLLGYYISRKQN